jgi:hypothetical protein
MGQACYTKEWCPGKMFMALNISRPSSTMKTWIKKYKSSGGGGTTTFSNLFNFNVLNGNQQDMLTTNNHSTLSAPSRGSPRTGRVWSDVHGKYMAIESLWKEIDPLTGELLPVCPLPPSTFDLRPSSRLSH